MEHQDDEDIAVHTSSNGKGCTEGGKDGETTVTTNNKAWLEFPLDFFTLVGGIPKEEGDLLTHWHLRLDRVKEGEEDREPVCAKTLRRDMKMVKKSLKDYVQAKFLEGAREMAARFGIKREQDGQAITLEKDLIAEICKLDSTPSNHNLVYKVVLEFHRKGTWLASVIDEWFLVNNYILVQKGGDPERKPHKTNKGGFSAIGRDAKKQSVANIMCPLQAKKGWSLATTKKEKDGCLGVAKKYHGREIEVGGEKLWYYVVVAAGGQKKGVAKGVGEAVVSGTGVWVFGYIG